jgi:hypothetical protein
MDEDKGVLRWGGLAGILGGIVFHIVLGWKVYSLSRAP